MQTQTILGAGGIISIELAKALVNYNTNVRLVARNPKHVVGNEELVVADLTKKDQLFSAVEGSEVVYLTAGFPYSAKVWKEVWPAVMRNTIDACKKYNARLVFFDNIYMYDKNYLNNQTEETPVNPCSKKGRVRAQIAQMLLDEVEKGTLKALIARSADFYGTGNIKTSILAELVLKNLAAGKAAMWQSSLNFKHSFTYTPDAGKATAILGNTLDAFGQVWHLPTAANPLTGKEWISQIADQMKVKAKSRVISKGMMKLLGVFVPIMREIVEMMYQYDRDYVFNSKKFEQKFNFTPTPYSKGIQEIIDADYK